MSGSETTDDITVDHTSGRHSDILSTNFHDLYEQGLFTDCQLETGERKIPCHRPVLSAYSPVLNAMLTAGMTESITSTIPVVGFSADIMECVLKYMYTGVLNAPRDDLHTLIAASDFYEMIPLKDSLEEEMIHIVQPSNAIRWRKFTLRYNLARGIDCCDRIMILKFSQVVQHEDFLAMTKEEVVQYFQKCKPFADHIGQGEILQAAVSWMSKHKETASKHEELLCCIDFEKCTKKSLSDAATHYDIPEPFKRIITRNTPRYTRTLAYMTDRQCLVQDNAGQLRRLTDHGVSSYCGHRKGIYAMGNGVVEMVRRWKLNKMVPCKILKYEAPAFTKKTAFKYGDDAEPRDYNLITVHGNKLYMFSKEAQADEYCECFDFDLRSLSQVPFSLTYMDEDIPWKAASVGEDLYIITRRLRLLRLRDNVFTEIPSQPAADFGNKYHMMNVNVIAVHVWLYVIITKRKVRSCWTEQFEKIWRMEVLGERMTRGELDEIRRMQELEANMTMEELNEFWMLQDLEEKLTMKELKEIRNRAYCYSAEMDVWTELNAEMDSAPNEIFLLGNKILLTAHNRKIYEYDTVTGKVTDTKRCIPQGDVRPLVINVKSRYLGHKSALPLLSIKE